MKMINIEQFLSFLKFFFKVDFVIVGLKCFWENSFSILKYCGKLAF